MLGSWLHTGWEVLGVGRQKISAVAGYSFSRCATPSSCPPLRPTTCLLPHQTAPSPPSNLWPLPPISGKPLNPPSLSTPLPRNAPNAPAPHHPQVRYTFLLSTLMSHNMPTALLGPTGTGKSAYIKAHLSKGLDRSAWTTMAFNFSAQTSVNMTQVWGTARALEGSRRKGAGGEWQASLSTCWLPCGLTLVPHISINRRT